MAIPVVAVIDFECLQVNRQFAQRKRRYATRCKIKSRTALRFGPMHVVGMLVSHEQGQCSTKEHSHLGWVADRRLGCRAKHLKPGETPGCRTDEMPVLPPPDQRQSASGRLLQASGLCSPAAEVPLNALWQEIRKT